MTNQQDSSHQESLHQDNTVQTGASRAQKGGCTVQGVFYRGGQFLPSYEPQRGKWNTATSKNGNKKNKGVKRREVAPYVWEVQPYEGAVAVYGRLSMYARFEYKSRVATYQHSEAVLRHLGLTEEEARRKVDDYNNGQVWE
jgi:hypothetical protein